MPSLLALLGTCLTVVAAADPADYRSDDGAPAQRVGVGFSVAGEDSRREPAASATPTRDPQAGAPGAPPADGAAESAPNPRPDPHGNAAPAVFPEQADSLAVRLAAAREPVAEQAKKELAEKTSSTGPVNVLRPPPKPTSDEHRSPAPLPACVPARPSASLASPASAPLAASASSLSLGGRGEKGPPPNASPISAVCTVGGALSTVLGLFLVVAWAMRKASPRGALVLPKEVFEVLGRAPLGARQQVQLLRCGGKLLLVSITPHGAETLTEVTDPVEVDRVAGICQQGNPKSSTTAFRQVFQQLATADKPPAGDGPQVGVARRKRYRWEEKHA